MSTSITVVPRTYPERQWTDTGSRSFEQPSGTWLPSTHWISQLPLRAVYPRPDGEPNTWARHHWAYYDGTNALPYQVPLGVSFGAYPYNYQIMDGPSGLTVVTPPLSQGPPYPCAYVDWTPTGSVTNQRIWIRVWDQALTFVDLIWTVSTVGGYYYNATTPTDSYGFIFADATNGTDPSSYPSVTGLITQGTYSAPMQTVGWVYGTTTTAQTYPGAVLYIKGATTKYVLPGYTDLSPPAFRFYNNLKPAAIIQLPASGTATFDTTTHRFNSYTAQDDIFLQGFTSDGYDPTQADNWLFWDGSNGNRRVLDGLSWINAGYGTTGHGNSSMVFATQTGSASTIRNYWLLNNLSESNRQSGQPANNFSICSLYCITDVLIQGCHANEPATNCDATIFMKSDIKYGCARGNWVSYLSAIYGFSCTQSILAVNSYNECCYNVGININGIFLPRGTSGPFGPLWCYRNNVIGNMGIASNEANRWGPYIFESNVTQTTNSPQPPSGAAVKDAGGNISAPSGILDNTTGLLTASYASYRGTNGAEIA